MIKKSKFYVCVLTMTVFLFCITAQGQTSTPSVATPTVSTPTVSTPTVQDVQLPKQVEGQSSSRKRAANGTPLPYYETQESKGNSADSWSAFSAIENKISSNKKGEKKDTASKAETFFGNVWDQFGFAVNARMDLSYNRDKGDDNTVNFDIHSLKLVFDGYVIPQIRYYVKLRLTSSGGDHRDNTGSALNKAWVAIDVKNFSITVGRQDLLFAAWEYDQDYADMYMSSVVNDKIDGVGSGISVDYKFYKQHIALQVINSSPVNFTNTKNSFAWTARYVGDIWNGLLQPAISFTKVNNAVRKDLYFATSGIKYEQDKLIASLDYYDGKYIESTSLKFDDIDTVVTDYVRDVSVVLNLGYRFLPQWNAILKGTFDMRHDAQTKLRLFNRYGISVAIEYMPFKKIPLRAHASFSYQYYNYKPAWIEMLIGTKKVDEITATIGLRWLFRVK